MYGSEDQKRISTFIVVGFVLIIVGGIGFLLTGLGGEAIVGQARTLAIAGFFILAGLIGAGLLVAAMVIGGKQAFANNADKPAETAENVYIMSVLILNENQDPIYDPDMYDEDDLRCYVQIEFSDGQKREFETNLAVLSTIGEGMRGNISYQGKWLSQFVMVPQSGGRPYST